MKKMHLFLVCILSTLILSCAKKADYSFDQKMVSFYKSTLDAINKTQYVPYYREYKKSKLDFLHYNINENEEQFLKDSTLRSNSLKDFYAYDRKFINWLLTFETDKKVDKNSKKTALWLQFRDPYSDKMTPCEFSTSKAEQAVNIMYAWLRKSEIECLGCPSTQNICMKKAYAGIKSFLTKNDQTTAQDLQKAWSLHVKSNGNS